MKMNKTSLVWWFYCLLIVNVVYSTKTYTVNEESGVDSYIGNVPQDFNLPSLSQNDEPRYYRIITGQDLIRVHNATGDLHTVVQLDREKLCPDNPPECILNAEVAVLPKQHLRVLKVVIRVKDLNDNVPQFLINPMVRDISESAAVGSAIRLDSSIDPDLGKNSIQSYKIASSPPSVDDQDGRTVPYFQLDVIENIDGTKIPQLVLTQELDREQDASYELLLYAIDGGRRPQTGTATIQIKVTDSNDNQPFFEKDRYIVEVNEDVEPGYKVVQLKANDFDEGHNARIQYAFPSSVNKHDRSIFNLNSSTGVLSIKGVGLDYEDKTIHHLTVEAKDGGANSASAYASVSVQVLDVNDEPPVIDVNFVEESENNGQDTPDEGQPKAILIRENLAIGTPLAFVTVTDRDSGTSGNVSCRLKDTKSFEMETLDEEDNRYLIKTKGVLDREAKRFYNIEIEAWDFGRPSLSSIATRVVELMDENDNSPTFVKDIYYLSVSENREANSVIATLKAEDLDDGENARVTYSSEPLQSDKIVPFAINADSGEVYFVKNSKPLDAENSTGPFRLRVVATDNGFPRRNTSTILEISVSDENDNKPRFEQKNYVFRIYENEKFGKFVGSVSADDDDIDKTTNGKVTYSIVEGGSPFSIKPTTGEISFVGKAIDLDRESRQSQPYMFTVLATDNGDIPLNDECAVEIYLLDVNDNPPRIFYPNVTRDITYLYITSQSKSRAKTVRRALKLLNEGTNTTSETSESPEKPVARESSLKNSLLIGSSRTKKTRSPKTAPAVLTKINASDPDEGENGRVRFVLTRGNVNDYFAVDTHSGNVSLTTDDDTTLRQMKHGCYVIEVDVKDLGKTILQTTTWVNIYITDAMPGSLNDSLIMRECMNNSFYPVQYLPPSIHSAGFTWTWWMTVIVGGTVGFIVLVAIIIILVKKCRCCGNQSHIYSCKKANDFGNTEYARRSPVNGKKGSKQKASNGTVDSRTSFVDWNALQKQHPAQGAGQMLLPAEQSDGSVHSRNSGKDSGTGDSMPSDAYHTTAGARQPHMNQFYAGHIPNYPPTQAAHLYQAPQDDILTADDDSRVDAYPYPRCTEECQIHGHSDLCWMPDPQQRQPPRMTPHQSGVEEFDGNSLKYRKRSMTPSYYQHNGDNARYVAIPSNTPYYYDPGSKFDDVSSHPASSTYRDDLMEDNAFSQVTSSTMAGAIPLHSFRQPGYAGQGQPSYGRSPLPYGGPSPAPHVGQAYRGKPYVNMPSAGYEPERVMIEEAHSNLSSSEIENRFPNQQNQHGYQQYGSQQSYPVHYASGYNLDGYNEHLRTPAPYEGDPHGLVSGQSYEEDFAATNLLMSPAYSETGDNKHALERQMKQYQQHGFQNDSEQNPSGNTANLPTDPTDPAYNEKLGTIREEIDADAVVAEIDGLLL